MPSAAPKLAHQPVVGACGCVLVRVHAGTDDAAAPAPDAHPRVPVVGATAVDRRAAHAQRRVHDRALAMQPDGGVGVRATGPAWPDRAGGATSSWRRLGWQFAGLTSRLQATPKSSTTRPRIRSSISRCPETSSTRPPVPVSNAEPSPSNSPRTKCRRSGAGQRSSARTIASSDDLRSIMPAWWRSWMSAGLWDAMTGMPNAVTRTRTSMQFASTSRWSRSVLDSWTLNMTPRLSGARQPSAAMKPTQYARGSPSTVSK